MMKTHVARQRLASSAWQSSAFYLSLVGLVPIAFRKLLGNAIIADIKRGPHKPALLHGTMAEKPGVPLQAV